MARGGVGILTDLDILDEEQCICNGHMRKGDDGGLCSSTFKSKPYCYVNPGVCSDGTPSTTEINNEWSYLACDKLNEESENKILNATNARAPAPTGRFNDNNNNNAGAFKMDAEDLQRVIDTANNNARAPAPTENRNYQ